VEFNQNAPGKGQFENPVTGYAISRATLAQQGNLSKYLKGTQAPSYLTNIHHRTTKLQFVRLLQEVVEQCTASPGSQPGRRLRYVYTPVLGRLVTRELSIFRPRIFLWRLSITGTNPQEGPMARYGKAASKSVQAAMSREKHGTLRSGKGGKGGIVTSRKQAIAIGLSEARKKGAKVPREKSK
jgi:hypothetical protein